MTGPPYNNYDNPNPSGKPPGGRPLKFATPELLEEAINAYFEYCDSHPIHKQHVTGKGEVVTVQIPEPYTMAGLAHHLGVERHYLNSLVDSGVNSGNDSFSSVVSRARAKIQRQNLSQAMLGCHDSKIAALNLSSNFGYSAKSEIDHRMPDLAATLRDLDNSEED